MQDIAIYAFVIVTVVCCLGLLALLGRLLAWFVACEIIEARRRK